LGTDKIHIYELTPKNPNPLTPATPAYVRLPAGSGPRHFTLHPNGKFAYVINELTGQLTAFSVNNGTLQPLQTLGMLPASYKGNQYEADAADIHISPDGKFLYGSLRADINELVLFQIASNGRLAYRNRYSTLGEGPRNFAIDPSGNFLLAGNSGSDEIIIFKRNKKNGELTPAGKKISLGSPVCLKFVAKD
jgi:6-phosphogluconolactonase